jgi:hypothetical protein
MAAALVGIIINNSIAFIKLLTGENMRQGPVDYIILKY